MDGLYYFNMELNEFKPEWKKFSDEMWDIGYNWRPSLMGFSIIGFDNSMNAYMRYYNKDYKMKTVFAKCLARISKLRWVAAWNKYGGVMMKASPTLKEAGARGRLMRIIKIKMLAGDFKRYDYQHLKNGPIDYGCIQYFILQKRKYVRPVAEMNLYDGIGIMYEAQLERDKIGAVSLNDDVMSVVRGFLIK